MRWLVIGAMVFLMGLGSARAQPPPGDPMVWQPGHWHWDGYQYVWVGGHYVPARPHWREGRWIWSPREGQWVWRPAHWE
jgi:WXXGXW repeat (2 copies)